MACAQQFCDNEARAGRRGARDGDTWCDSARAAPAPAQARQASRRFIAHLYCTARGLSSPWRRPDGSEHGGKRHSAARQRQDTRPLPPALAHDRAQRLSNCPSVKVVSANEPDRPRETSKLEAVSVVKLNRVSGTGTAHPWHLNPHCWARAWRGLWCAWLTAARLQVPRPRCPSMRRCPFALLTAMLQRIRQCRYMLLSRRRAFRPGCLSHAARAREF